MIDGALKAARIRLYQDAVALRDRKDFVAAKDVLLAGIELDSECPANLVLLGDTLSELEQREIALPYLQKAVALRPANDIASRALFHCYWNLGRVDEAIAEIYRFLKYGRHSDYDDIIRELQEKGWIAVG
jgi:tetratricopeptide (TPR) repeat protein